MLSFANRRLVYDELSANKHTFVRAKVAGRCKVVCDGRSWSRPVMQRSSRITASRSRQN